MVTTRSTPQGGQRSRDLSTFMKSPYVDNVVLLLQRNFIFTISKLMKSALDTQIEWTEEKCLRVNVSKTKLVLFTRKIKVLGFRQPR